MAEIREDIAELLRKPEFLMRKKPFTRGMGRDITGRPMKVEVGYNETVDGVIPSYKINTISQTEFMRELDPNCHNVLFDENIPAITMKTKDGGYLDIQYKRLSVSYQKNIKNKQVLHLCGNQMQFTLIGEEPTDEMEKDFITFKEYWQLRNQDGMKTKMVDCQKSFGDAGLLYYFDYKGQIKSRLLSYTDGYILCPHNDDNGDRVLESVYYSRDEVEYIDSYDDTYMYRHVKDGSAESNASGDWVLQSAKVHGFTEIPLITKRGAVAWDNVQPIIEVYEVIYNIYMVLQKRQGWGILYIKGKFRDEAKQIAGNIILNDTDISGNGSAEFKTPPTGEGMKDALELMEESIQKGSGTTFLLPKDVKMSGDISGIAIQLTQSLDIENALQGVIDWQNVADKMARLFKEGLAIELVNNKTQTNAITSFANLKINAKFDVWKPKSDAELVQLITQLKGAGGLSEETAIEINPLSKPNEKKRRKREVEVAEKKEQDKLAQQQAITAAANTNNNNQ